MKYGKSNRVLPLLLAAVMLLTLISGCGKKQAEDEGAQTPELPAAEEPQQEPQDPNQFVAEGNVNPLTGLCDGISDEALETRPVAVMVSNIISSLPQWGISKADVIYEMLAEGRITRFLAIFQDTDKIDKLASIRSSRPYFIDIAQSYGAVYLHFGGSEPAYDAMAARGDLIHIDGIKGSWEGTVFFRDPQRKKELGLEHSVYTTGEYVKLAKQKLTEQGYDLRQTTHPSAFQFSQRLDENSAVGGTPMTKVTVTFSDKHKPWFEYDPSTGKYLRFEYGDPQMDGLTNTQLAFTNVLVLRMETTDVPNSYLHLVEVQTSGTGDGYYFNGGTYVPITWKKDGYNGEIKYYEQSGAELTLARGQTFISVVTRTADVTIE